MLLQGWQVDASPGFANDLRGSKLDGHILSWLAMRMSNTMRSLAG